MYKNIVKIDALKTLPIDTVLTCNDWPGDTKPCKYIKKEPPETGPEWVLLSLKGDPTPHTCSSNDLWGKWAIIRVVE